MLRLTNQGRGLPSLPSRGDNGAHLFAQTRTLRIRHFYGLKLSSGMSTSPHLAAGILPRPDFHGFRGL